MKGVAQQERGSMTREAAVHQARWRGRRRCTVLLHNNQPCLDAFLAEWGVISTMMMTSMRTTTMTMTTVDNIMYDDYILVILHYNQPWSDAFLAD